MTYSVYILEDEDWLRAYLKKIIPWDTLNLIPAGEARDGLTASDAILSVRPDIFLCDIRVPGLSGLEVIRHVTAYQPELKSIIISGYQEFDYAREALDLGVESYLTKPVKEHDLTAALKKAISSIEDGRSGQRWQARARNSFYIDLLENRTDPPSFDFFHPERHTVCVSPFRKIPHPPFFTTVWTLPSRRFPPPVFSDIFIRKTAVNAVLFFLFPAIIIHMTGFPVF